MEALTDVPSAEGVEKANQEPTSFASLGQSVGGPEKSSSLTTDIRADVEREQALLDTERRVKELEEELSKLKEEKAALISAKDGAISTTDQLRTQLSSLQSSHHQATSELSVLNTRILAIDREKRELLEEAERLQERLSRNTQELYTLRSQKTEASQKIAHLDVEVSELRMAADSAKFNEQRSVQSLQSARNEVMTTSKAAGELEERFGKYRVEKQSELSSLQIEQDSLNTRLTSAESSHQALQRSYNDQSRRLAEAHANIANLTTAAASKKASTSIELHRLSEENRVLEKRNEDARATISDREVELERVILDRETEKKEWSDKLAAEEKRRKEAERRADDLHQVVEKLALAGGSGTNVSAAAALAGDMRKEGKTYTQFYMDYTLQESKLRNAENEVARLTGVLDEVVQDIAEKKPLLDEQASEHAAAIERANALAGELASAISKRDSYEAQVKSLTADATHHREEAVALQNTADDLSRQVQGLLRQVAIFNNPSLADQSISENSVESQGDIITDHLVEFKSIRSLQEQNQKLLKVTRGLMSKLDARESGAASTEQDELDVETSLDQATETITRQRTQLIDLQKKVNEVMNERDFFSKLLARGEGLKWTNPTGGPLEERDDSSGPHQQTIEALRAEIDEVRQKAEEEIRAAREDVRVKTQAVGQAEIGQAKAEAKASLLQEQSRSLNEANTLQRQQYDGLDAQYRQLQSSISQAQNERRSALEQVASKQAEADRLRNEAANIRAEREQWKSSESRLQADFRAVQTERAKLQQLIDNLNNVAAETERTRVEERNRLEKRVEELQRETTALRSQIDQARAATQAAEQKAQDFDARLATATTAVRAEKEAADALAKTRAEEITNLKSQLEAANLESEKRKTIGLNWKKRADVLNENMATERATQQSTISAKDKEISDIGEKIKVLEKELEDAKNKLSETEKKLADSQRADALKENTVQRLQSELNAAKARAPGSTSVDNNALTALQSERDGLQSRIAQLEKDLEAAKSVPAASAAASAAPAEIGSAPSDAEKLEMQTKLEALQKEKDELEKKYDDNVTKVNRVNASLRNRVGSLESIQSSADSRVAELEKQLTEAQKAQPTGESTPGGEAPSQTVIDEAVKKAVASREAELSQQHATALEQARQAISSATPGAASDEAAIQVALAAKEAFLNADFESRLSNAIASNKAEILEAEGKMKAQVDEMTEKVKKLERQLKTAEITRKTLERQKIEAENKLKKIEGGGGADAATPVAVAGASSTPTAANLSPAAAEFKPTQPATTTTTPAAGTTAPPATPATGAAPTGPAAGASVRGAARGRGVRGAATRGRGGAAGRSSVLDAVNATLSQSGTLPPTSPTGTKRPLPEDGEISESTGAAGGNDILSRIQGTPAVGTTASTATTTPSGARVIKRPRGAAPRGGGPARGGAAAAAAAGRRTSQGGDNAAAGGSGNAGGDSTAGGTAPSGGEGGST